MISFAYGCGTPRRNSAGQAQLCRAPQTRRLALGLSYAPNRMSFHRWDDAREKRVRDAVYQCLTESPSVSLEQRP
jgi:hypothetical protein